MRPVRALLCLTLATVAVSAVAACGQGPVAPGMAAARARAAMQARNLDGWEDPITLEDFDETDNRYANLSPTNHPFFAPLRFTPVRASAAGSTVLELLGSNQSKLRKGLVLTEDIEEDGALTRTVAEKTTIAEQAKVSFRWGNNGGTTTDPCIYASVVFVFESKRLGTRAIAYAWTNRYAPGTVIPSQIGSDDSEIKMRIVCLQNGAGLGAPCDESALQKIQTNAIERDFCADVRWAFAESTKLTEPGSVPAADAQAAVTAFPPAGFVVDAGGRKISNTDITGIVQLGFAGEIAKGVCSHAIVDDVRIQKKWL